jgi:hypothetical protein
VLVLAVLLSIAAGFVRAQEPGPQVSFRSQETLGTAFTYQGQLTDGGSPADGAYDFEFKLYDDPDAGAQVADPFTVEDKMVTDGLFTVELDFGEGVFTGQARYLEIGVRAGASVGAHTTLWPRQPLTAAPYALSLPGLYTLPNTFSPNVVGGAPTNVIWDDLVGATIGGGGGADIENVITDRFSTVSGGADNLAGDESPDATDAWFATIGGGWQNRASSVNATVAGGAENVASGVSSFVGGGWQNVAGGEEHSTVSGGVGNQAIGAYNATIAGGDHNVASGMWNATVSGGANNVASGDEATVSGGAENTASGDFNATVGGGYRNLAGGTDATVGGGNSNTATGWAATISGGYTNTVTAGAATVSGGQRNEANAGHSVVAGGYWNVTYGITSTISGGQQNFINRDYATIGGGRNNQIYGDFGTIGGGGGEDEAGANVVHDHGGTIAGGTANRVGTDDADPTDAMYATVCGGDDNLAQALGAAVSGGAWNRAGGVGASVGGGWANVASGDYATVGGGGPVDFFQAVVGNYATNDYATVAGGGQNEARGLYATVPGGARNLAEGDHSFAAGNRAKASQDGCFVWGDSSNSDIACQLDDEFVVRASGGVYLYTSSDLSSGAYLGPGLSNWNPLPPPSDRNLKENVALVDPRTVLDKMLAVPISTWNYKSQEAEVRHMGPMAQDFYAAFGLGQDEGHISTIDADGVALAAIQGLHELSQEQAGRIEVLEAENADLRHELDSLAARVSALESQPRESVESTLLSGVGLLMVGIGAVWVFRRRHTPMASQGGGP